MINCGVTNITYKDGIIQLKTGPLNITLEGRIIKISFNILLLGNDEAVLGMPFLQEFNPKIN